MPSDDDSDDGICQLMTDDGIFPVTMTMMIVLAEAMMSMMIVFAE